MKCGKNSNKADAQGDNWEEILSADTFCLSKLWISWSKNHQHNHRLMSYIKASNRKKLLSSKARGMWRELERSHCLTLVTFNSAYTSGMLSISPSGRRMTPWFLSGAYIQGQENTMTTKLFLTWNKGTWIIWPCSALAWTASQICFVMSKSVSFDAATSSPRITC